MFKLLLYLNYTFMLQSLVEIYYFCNSSFRRAALEKWKQHNGSSATYRNLIVAFERADRKDYASKVHEIAGKSLNNYM